MLTALAALTVIALLFLAYEAKAAPLLPDMDAQRLLDASEGNANRRHTARSVFPFHGQPTATERREHPLGR